MVPRMLVALLVSSLHLWYSQAQSTGITRTTEGYQINARLFNATVDGNSIYGGLELSRIGTSWGYVCDKQLNSYTARVLCRMFNYTHGEGLTGGRFGQSSGVLFPDRFSCTGQESSVISCVTHTSYSTCNITAGLICFNDVDKVFEMQVVDGVKSPNQISGRLEVRLKPLVEWGSVCDDNFSAAAATAACKYMGYKTGEFTDTGVFGSSNQTYLDEVTCNDGEDFLSCNHNVWGHHDCTRSEDVGVLCVNSSVRLLSAVKKDYHIGSVEMYSPTDKGWFEVCDAGWDDVDAKIVCAELGFPDGKALLGNTLGSVSYGSLTGSGSVTNVNCTGAEQDLTNCSMRKTFTCGFNNSVINLAAVICYDKNVTEIDLSDKAQIVSETGSFNNVGILEIKHLGVWGRISEDSSIFNVPTASDKEATVACRMMSFQNSSFQKPKGIRLGKVTVTTGETYHTWLRGFSCNGTEDSIAKCRLPPWGIPGLLNSNAPVRIACFKTELSLKLRGGKNQTGQLYINHDGTELDICADKWSNIEANAACKQLGFTEGRTWFNESNNSITTSTVIGGVTCTSTADNFYLCIKNKWGIPKAECTSGPAGVSCFTNVKLDPGNADSGILQLYNNVRKQWSPICRSGFDDIDATTACKELGYSQGTNLPAGVFGDKYFVSSTYNISCNGTENSIHDCPYSNYSTPCSPSDYTSISCFDSADEGTFKLETNYSNSPEVYGVLRVYQNKTWGYVCDEFFSSTDAQAFCSKVGQAMGRNFNDSLKLKSLANVQGPFFISYPNCTLTTNAQYECNYGSYTCNERRAVSLLCAEKSAPKLQLLSGSETNSGRLVFSVNENVGTICANRWTDREAQVACREISSDYAAGSAKVYNHIDMPHVLSGMTCAGSESSLFQCSNDKWRNINITSCGSTSQDAGVLCYKKVFLKEQIVTGTSISGRLSMVLARVIRDVCFDWKFNYTLAEMACTEMGYSNAAVLKPAALDSSNRYSMVKQMFCAQRGISLTECRYNIGSCSDGQVRLLCYNTDINGVNGDWAIKSNTADIGQLRRTLFDQYTGVVCPVNFVDKDASATCFSLAQGKLGVTLGSPPLSSSEREIVWFGNIACTTPTTCIFQKNVSRECFNKNYSAGVICYQRQDYFSLRLVNNEIETKMAGRLEIKVNGVWGSVCSKIVNNFTAAAFCKQKGFVDGTTISSSPKRFGNGTGPIYLKDVACTRSNTKILECSNAGWKEVSNCTHEDDLEIMCHSQERFYPDPESHFGAVSLLTYNNYRQVCSDNFLDQEATVMCRALGYKTGKSICCSALSVPTLNIGVSRVQCQGYESSLLNCSFIRSGGLYSCPSQQFASAACSYEINNDYSLTLENNDNGRLVIDYFNIKGTVCADGFDHKDAKVACRQVGFNTGLAFTAGPSSYPLSWVSQLQCQGTESSLDYCSNFTLGNSSYCNSVASVFCFRQYGDDVIRVRLNGTTPNIGLLEVQINNTWGTVCYEQWPDLYTNVASVVCKQLGYRGGMLLPPGMISSGTGQVWLNSITCLGSESEIKECKLERLGTDQQNCLSHLYDLAIECYSSVRLINNKPELTDRGQLQLYNKETLHWQYVCDSVVTDREATLVCKTFGYQFGKALCCSAVGPLNFNSSFVTSINCPESATDINNCTYTSQAACSSGHYAYVQCSSTAFTDENLTIKSMATYVGQPMVTRFGIDGYICNDGLNHSEAQVICREMDYFSGQLLHPASQFGSVIMLNGLNCTGSEMSIHQCSFNSFSQMGSCPSMMVAKIICYKSSGITFNVKTTNFSSGLAEIHIGQRTMVVEDIHTNNLFASIFCRSIANKKYLTGSMYLHPVSNILQADVLMSSVYCEGHEANILECDATFLPANPNTNSLVHVECSTGANLEQGPGGVKSSGILTLYNKTLQTSGAICKTDFGQNEADVGCRMLGYQHGIVHCCLPFGYNYYNIMYKNFKCNGTEDSLFDCHHDTSALYNNYNFCSSRQDYVGLTCYNGTKSNYFNISIMSTSSSTNVGLLQVSYLNTTGSICNEGWDDNDARVACREINFANGIAYSHFKSTFSYTSSAGPFWVSHFQCNGSESRLADCPHSGLGTVNNCERSHFAGVLCTQQSGVEFRLAGTDKPNFGRVEVKINNVWGSVCDSYWDSRDASVMCRQLGYVTGEVMLSQDVPQGQGSVFQIAPRCIGNETKINDCPHEGWVTNEYSSCSSHSRDVGVFCYTSVRLGTGSGKSYRHGPVNVYDNDVWYRVCSDDFSDASAKAVCKEIGFYDGHALCCSAYKGEGYSRETLHPNITIKCSGDENNIQQCIKNEECSSTDYASVVCFDAEDIINATDYLFTLKKDFEAAGRIEVTHMNVTGRICSNNWTDIDARVFCKSIGHPDGLAYYHSYAESYVSASLIGPYWISNVSCFGNETSLTQCMFGDRLNLGNCSGAHTASAVCFNDTGIQYRISGQISSDGNAGRIEMAIDNVWGTLCGETWDNKDARVACRNLGYTDGEPEGNDKYGPGSGPIWLRDLQCTGNESALHVCPHTGFQNEIPSENDYHFPWLRMTCSNHKYDAAVFCFKEVKLNQRLDMSTGALLYNSNDNWVHVCDLDTFNRTEAKIACKSLMQNYIDGVPIRGGAFGKTAFPLEISSIVCTGTESTLSQCTVTKGSNCKFNQYISLACFNYTLSADDLNYQLRLSNDSIRTNDNHGILEVRQNGAWGRICLNGFTDKEATVACKELGGFTGGVVYLHLFKNRLPILWSSVTCNGNEASLQNCQHSTNVGTQNCSYHSNDAAVVCYKGEGVKYRLNGGAGAHKGRVEIGIDGNYSSLCSVYWNAANSRVLCKYLGYIDGLPTNQKNNSLANLETLMSFFLCEGNESSLFTCINSGFDGDRNPYYCGGEAYTECFHEEVKITQIRLRDGGEGHGRVEVYVTGINQWGTVCDDLWDYLDALVVCKYLGYSNGEAVVNTYKEGEGTIFLDNVECDGTEDSLGDCKHLGLSSHNCAHFEDAGVRCFNDTTTLISTTTVSTRTTMRTTPISSRTDEILTSTTTSHASLPSSTTLESTTTANNYVTNGPQTQAEGQNVKVIVGACIGILIAIVLIAIVIFVVLRHRLHSKSVPHTRFHDEDVVHYNDGSVAVSNRMFDISSSEVGGDPMADGSEVHLDGKGYVTFSKGSPNSEFQPNSQEGFDNPLYAVMRDPQDVGSESTT